MELTQSVGLGRTGTRAAMRASTVGSQATLDGGGSGVPGHGSPWQRPAAAALPCTPCSW